MEAEEGCQWEEEDGAPPKAGGLVPHLDVCFGLADPSIMTIEFPPHKAIASES